MNFKKIFLFFLSISFSFARLLILGLGSLFLVLYSIDNYTNPKKGIENLYIIVGALSFFPVFIPIFFESFIYFTKTSLKKTKKKNTSYLKESITNEK